MVLLDHNPSIVKQEHLRLEFKASAAEEQDTDSKQPGRRLKEGRGAE